MTAGSLPMRNNIGSPSLCERSDLNRRKDKSALS